MSHAELQQHIRHQQEYNRKYYQAKKAIAAGSDWVKEQLAVWEEFWSGRTAEELKDRDDCEAELLQLKRRFSPVQHQIRLHKRWLAKRLAAGTASEVSRPFSL